MKPVEVVVIGGGVVGCACAYYLTKAGISTALVERNELASGTSGACDGGVILQTKKPGVHLELAWESAQLFPNLAHELEQDFEYQSASVMLIAKNEAELAAARLFVQQQQAGGLEVKLLSHDEAQRIEPALQGEFLAATFLSASYGLTDATVNPMLLTYAFASAARRQGASIYLNTTVIGIESQAGRVERVVTSQGTLSCRWIVNAAGAWAASICQMFGMKVAIKPRRGQLMVTEPLAPLLNRYILSASYLALKFEQSFAEKGDFGKNPLVVKDGSLALEQTISGTILIGSSREFVGYDLSNSFDLLSSLARSAIQLVPALKFARIIRSFAGLRPYTPDGLPLLGEVQCLKGFVMAAGHEGDGIALSAITGKLITQLISGHTLSFPLESFRPERFNS